MDEMKPILDSKLVQTLTESIEYISHNGLQQVEPAKLKEIKKICRISEDYVAEAFKILMHQLSEKHAEVRLASLGVVKELFGRSHHFRELLSSSFQDFSKLVFDIDPKLPLPAPKSVAKQLKLEATKAVKEWTSVYGDVYKKLKIGFRYLQQSKVVDFDNFDGRSVSQRREDDLHESRLNTVKQKMLESLKDEIVNQECGIKSSLSEMENGFSLLTPDEFDNVDDECLKNESAASSNDLREHGIMSNQEFSLMIDFKPTPLQINSDNRDVVNCLREQHRQLEARFWPLIVRWNISAAKAGADELLQKRIIDLKTRASSVLTKYKQLGLDQVDSEDSSDSDLETVPDAETFDEESVIEAQILSMAQFQEPSKAKKSRVSESKGALPIDIESYQASQSSAFPLKFPVAQIESYWVRDPETEQGSTDVIITPVGTTEKFLPVKWTCRAPLPSGKLCPRRDRIKCPLHGAIVARDEHGNPIDPSSVQQPRKSSVPDWQDPMLLADIKAATGVDLTMPVKGKRLKKNPFPNLTDLKKLNDTSRKRLEKKIFKREVVRKVAATMDALDTKSQLEKFGNQWNYS